MKPHPEQFIRLKDAPKKGLYEGRFNISKKVLVYSKSESGREYLIKADSSHECIYVSVNKVVLLD